MSRGVGAALVAAAVVLSGCGASNGEDTTTAPSSSPVTKPSNNPWGLPIEQRPALFDPCTEIPLEAVEKGLGGPVEPIDLYTRHQPGDLMACGWETEELEISVLSTWKSRSDYTADRAFVVEDNELDGRPGMRALDKIDNSERACLQFFFTERGTVWLKLDLLDLYRVFRGVRLADACSALEQVIPPIMAHYPDGDFQ